MAGKKGNPARLPVFGPLPCRRLIFLGTSGFWIYYCGQPPILLREAPVRGMTGSFSARHQTKGLIHEIRDLLHALETIYATDFHCRPARMPDIPGLHRPSGTLCRNPADP